MRALKYSLDEAIGSLWRGRQSGVFSMATIAVALFVPANSIAPSREMSLATGEPACVSADWTDGIGLLGFSATCTSQRTLPVFRSNATKCASIVPTKI